MSIFDKKKKPEVPEVTGVELLELPSSTRVVVNFGFSVEKKMTFQEITNEIDSIVMEKRNEIIKKFANKLGVDVNFVD